MTPNQIHEMTDRELDRAICERLGWTGIRESRTRPSRDVGYQLPSGPDYVPRYSTEIKDAIALGDELERRGLAREYGRRLATSLNIDATHSSAFMIAQASARQRAEAALLCLQEGTDGT